MMMHLLLGIIFFSVCNARIYQSSTTGENGMVDYSMSVKGGQSECCVLLASGNLTVINTVLNFDAGNTTYSDARDMFIIVRQSVPGDGPNCIQYGGWNYEEPDCASGGLWPDSWESSNSTTYEATADFSAYGLSGSEWEVCVGNGYIDQRESAAPSYEGNLDFTSSLITTGLPPTFTPTTPPSMAPSLSHVPTGSPSFSQSPSSQPTLVPSAVPSLSIAPTASAFDIVSNCGEVVDIDFSTSLSGAEKVCSNFPASEKLEFVRISMQFSGASDDEFASDMLLIIVNTSGTSGIQIGGYNSYVDGLSYVDSWPVGWDTSTSGVYSATVNVSEYNIAGEGYYKICIANGYANADTVQYTGNVDLPELVYRCDLPPPDPLPSSAPTEMPTVNPSFAPTVSPTASPTFSPTASPTFSPSASPTLSPTFAQTDLSSNSTLGKTSSVSFDAHVSGDQYLCEEIFSTGQIYNVSLSTYFSSSTPEVQASDFMLTVVTPTTDRCIVIGGGVTSLVCPDPVRTYSWANSLDSTESGDYADVVDVSASLLAGDGAWEVQICDPNLMLLSRVTFDAMINSS